jgi:two-component system NtrC family sensor kinase
MVDSERQPYAYLYPFKAYSNIEEVYPLAKRTVTIGRHAANDIPLPFMVVSRQHARIELHEGGALLTDLNSSNGTFVNNRRIQSRPLDEGDVVSFGNIEFYFTHESSEERKKKRDTTIQMVSAEQGQVSTILATKNTSETLDLLEAATKVQDRASLLKASMRLGTLYKMSDLLRTVPNEKIMLERVVDLIFDVLPADRGVILMPSSIPDTGFEPVVVKHRYPQLEEKSIPISRTLINKCHAEQVAVLSRDARSDPRFSASDSIQVHDMRSTMCVPLVAKGEVLGVMHIDTKESVHAFSEDDLTFLSSLANELAVWLDYLKLQDDMIRNERMAAIGQTITGIAHNVKNILLLSKAGSQLMDRNLEDGSLDTVRENWGIIKRAIDNISNLVQDMLEYSRPRIAEKTTCDVNAIIRDTCMTFEHQLTEKNIELLFDLDSNLSAFLLDAKGFEKCLLNLLTNAYEAITHQQGKISVKTQLTSDGALVVYFRDNGVGIPSDKIHKIFYPFFTTKGSRGTGIGLAMTKKFIDDMGGKIAVDSSEEEGTTFTITFFPESEKTIDTRVE